MSGSWTIHFLYFSWILSMALMYQAFCRTHQLKEAAPLFGVFVKILFSMVVNYFDWVPTEKILIVTPGVFFYLLPPRISLLGEQLKPFPRALWSNQPNMLLSLSWIFQTSETKNSALHLWYMFLSRPTLICSLIAAHPWRTTCNKRSFDQQKQKFFLSTKAKVF